MGRNLFFLFPKDMNMLLRILTILVSIVVFIISLGGGVVGCGSSSSDSDESPGDNTTPAVCENNLPAIMVDNDISADTHWTAAVYSLKDSITISRNSNGRSLCESLDSQWRKHNRSRQWRIKTSGNLGKTAHYFQQSFSPGGRLGIYRDL